MPMAGCHKSRGKYIVTEATLRLQRNYTADIKVFDDIENEALKMADYMFCGIIKMCSC